MAFGMKHWIGLTAAGMAVATAYLYPPRSADDLNELFVRERPGTPAGDHLVDLEGQARDLRTRLQRSLWLDSLKEVLVRDHQAGRHVTLGRPSDWTDWAADSIASAFHRQVEALGGGRSDVQVGVFLIDDDDALPRELDGRVNLRGWEYYAGTLEDGQPYCFALIAGGNASFVRVWMDGNDLGEPPLGPCRWWARYGPPGQHVARWLRDGGLAFAAEDDGSSYLNRYVLFSGDLRDSRALVSVVNGQWSYRMEQTDIRAESCLRGDLATCRELLAAPSSDSRMFRVWDQQLTATEAHLQETTDFWISSDGINRLASASFPAPVGVLFRDLRKEFGDDAVEHFWTDERPMPEAFEASFGVEPGDQVQRWISRYDKPTQGPQLGFGTLALSLLVLAGTFAIAFRTHARRQVA